jgi:hypothetical protein
MAFTDESRVRTHSGWDNTDLVPSELLARRIEDAHDELLAAIDPAYAGGDALLTLAETELATAFTLRSLAVESGFEDRDIRTGNLTLRAGGRAATLADLAEREERAAWRHARPFLKTGATRTAFKLVTGD